MLEPEIDNIFDVKSFGDIKCDENINPFIESLKISEHITLKRFKAGQVVIPDEIDIPLKEAQELTAQNEGLKPKGLEIARRRVTQKANFILVYNAPLINYRAMSEASFKILFFIWEKKLALGLDYIVLSINDCCTELGLTRPTIVKGFVELVRNKLIYKRTESVWWINPNYFYAGDRTKIRTK